MNQAEQVATGFSAMAAVYDETATSNPIVAWMRGRIRDAVEARLPPGGSILEINAGSGVDAAYFACERLSSPRDGRCAGNAGRDRREGVAASA